MDRRMRELERRAKSGDPSAEQALLRERVGIHDLRRKKLRLAAYLGHEPAESVHAEYLRKKDQRFDKWVRGLRHHGGPEAALRIALCAAEALLPAWAEVFPHDRWPGRAVEHARAALAAATQDDRDAVAEGAVDIVERTLASRQEHRHEARDSTVRGVKVRSALRAATCAEQVVRLSVLHCAKTYDAMFGLHYERAVQLAVDGVGERAIRARIQRDLLAWALA